MERFFREARSTFKLDHPNIVRVLTVDQEGDTYYLVMEFVDGESAIRPKELTAPQRPHHRGRSSPSAGAPQLQHLQSDSMSLIDPKTRRKGGRP